MILLCWIAGLLSRLLHDDERCPNPECEKRRADLQKHLSTEKTSENG